MTGGVRLEPWPGGAPPVGPANAPLAADTVAVLTEKRRPAPWGCHLAHAGGEIVGICAFKGAPDREGTVEIAYLTLPPFEWRGHATAMIAALLDIAEQAGAACLIAHTLPEVNASARALARNGFVMLEEVEDPEDGTVWYWERVLG